MAQIFTTLIVLACPWAWPRWCCCLPWAGGSPAAHWVPPRGA